METFSVAAGEKIHYNYAVADSVRENGGGQIFDFLHDIILLNTFNINGC